MIGLKSRAALAFGMVVALSACSNKTDDDRGIYGMLFDTVRQSAGSMGKSSAAAKPAAPADPGAMAAEALRVNPGPLILVGLESMGTTQVLAMTGDNNGMRTYMTKNEQALILRNGMLVGTRGLGNDLSVAEAAGSAALIRASRSGQAERTMRYFSGDGLERPLPMTCTVAPGPNAGVMLESCEGYGAKFQNNYLVQGGRVTVSRQWIGPALGYVTIQELRP